jgi:hypothetical protein
MRSTDTGHRNPSATASRPFAAAREYQRSAFTPVLMYQLEESSDQ